MIRVRYSLLMGAAFAVSLISSAQDLPPDVVLEKHQQEGSGNAVWVYRPKDLPPSGRLPWVLIGPAGSRLLDGMRVTDGDMAEHLPYVKAGFAVVSFDISGILPEDPSEKQILKTVNTFVQRRCGVEDARDAARLALQKHPFLDPDRLHVAGHSSAATLALQTAQDSPKIKACIAFAPVVDVPAHLGEDSLRFLKPTGLPDLLQQNSPHLHADKIACPVFLFCAKDDDVVDASSVRAYAAKLRQGGGQVEHVEVESGGHYDGMIQSGIAQAIEWLKKQNTHPPAAAKP